MLLKAAKVMIATKKLNQYPKDIGKGKTYTENKVNNKVDSTRKREGAVC